MAKDPKAPLRDKLSEHIAELSVIKDEAGRKLEKALQVRANLYSDGGVDRAKTLLEELEPPKQAKKISKD